MFYPTTHTLSFFIWEALEHVIYRLICIPIPITACYFPTLSVPNPSPKKLKKKKHEMSWTRWKISVIPLKNPTDWSKLWEEDKANHERGRWIYGCWMVELLKDERWMEMWGWDLRGIEDVKVELRGSAREVRDDKLGDGKGKKLTLNFKIYTQAVQFGFKWGFWNWNVWFQNSIKLNRTTFSVLVKTWVGFY